MNYAVVTTAQNTGLDSAIFATREEAEQAIEVSKQIFGKSRFDIVKTNEPVNTTFEEWDNAGW
jgi:hypothetical protein